MRHNWTTGPHPAATLTETGPSAYDGTARYYRALAIADPEHVARLAAIDAVRDLTGDTAEGGALRAAYAIDDAAQNTPAVLADAYNVTETLDAERLAEWARVIVDTTHAAAIAHAATR